MTHSLLPPNATPLQRAIEATGARVGDIAVPLDTLWNPATIDAQWLPWLAWGLSVDNWDADWSEAEKRRQIADAIALHRIKGTRASVETVAARFDQLIEIVEWHEATPRAAPHTFDVILPITGIGIAPGGDRATAAFARAIVRDISAVKPVREHFRLAQRLAVDGDIAVQGVARATIAQRQDMAFTVDPSNHWNALLQTEDGEPLQDDAAAFLDTAP